MVRSFANSGFRNEQLKSPPIKIRSFCGSNPRCFQSLRKYSIARSRRGAEASLPPRLLFRCSVYTVRPRFFVPKCAPRNPRTGRSGVSGKV